MVLLFLILNIMKSFFIVLHLLTVSLIFGQAFSLSKFEICDNDNTYQKIILNFQNQNEESIILKLNKQDYLTIGNDIYSHYIVDSENLIVRSSKLSKEQDSLCRLLIDKLLSINPNFLNIITNENNETISVEDGTTYQIELYKKRCKVSYNTYSPNVYIDNKYPHFEERKKLLDVYNGLKPFFYNKEYEELKNADSIYLIHNMSDKIKNLKIIKIPNNGNDTYVFSFTNGNRLNLRVDNSVTTLKKRPLSNSVIKIDLNKFNEYGFDAMCEILRNKKTIYIIGKGIRNKPKSVIKRAYLFCYP